MAPVIRTAKQATEWIDAIRLSGAHYVLDIPIHDDCIGIVARTWTGSSANFDTAAQCGQYIQSIGKMRTTTPPAGVVLFYAVNEGGQGHAVTTGGNGFMWQNDGPIYNQINYVPQSWPVDNWKLPITGWCYPADIWGSIVPVAKPLKENNMGGTTVSGWPTLDNPNWSDPRLKTFTVPGTRSLTAPFGRKLVLRWDIGTVLVDVCAQLNARCQQKITKYTDGYDARQAHAAPGQDSDHWGGAAFDYSYDVWKQARFDMPTMFDRDKVLRLLREYQGVVRWGGYYGGGPYGGDLRPAPGTSTAHWYDPMHFYLVGGTQRVLAVKADLNIDSEGVRHPRIVIPSKPKPPVPPKPPVVTTGPPRSGGKPIPVPTPTPVHKAAPFPKGGLREGDSGAAVVSLQLGLIRHECWIHSISAGTAKPGYFGPETKTAVIAFQRRHLAELGPADGVVGPKTYAMATA